MGARFEYEGAAYVKTGPQLASGPNGQRLIPKYAMLQVREGIIAPDGKKADRLARAAVLAAFETFYEKCTVLMPADQQAQAVAAREAFLKSLG